MSNARRPKNPFDDDYEEPDDFVFLPRGTSKPAEKRCDFGDFGYGEEERESPNGAYSLQTQIEDTQRNMLHSTQRSLGLMYEAEDVGNETAHELLRQGEQLKNVETKVDKINKDLDSSKRHVTALRSVFGGVINYFQGKKSEPEKTAESSRAPGKLQGIVGGGSAGGADRAADSSEHPAMRLRDPNPRNYSGGGGGRYDISGFEAVAPSSSSSSSRGASHHNSQRQAFDEQLDNNLDEMSSGLSRLKNLGLGLGDEIERQNDDIDRITAKTGNVDTRIEGVNRDINKILYR